MPARLAFALSITQLAGRLLVLHWKMPNRISLAKLAPLFSPVHLVISRDSSTTAAGLQTPIVLRPIPQFQTFILTWLSRQQS